MYVLHCGTPSHFVETMGLSFNESILCTATILNKYEYLKSVLIESVCSSQKSSKHKSRAEADQGKPKYNVQQQEYEYSSQPNLQTSHYGTVQSIQRQINITRHFCFCLYQSQKISLWSVTQNTAFHTCKLNTL
jgi:hypothetical protein